MNSTVRVSVFQACLIIAVLLSGAWGPDVQAADLVQAGGKLTLLRVHGLGSGYGPPDDHIDVEVVIRLDSKPDMTFGFQLRDNNPDTSVRQAMVSLLRDAFENNWNVTIDYWIDPGKKNGLVHRVWLSK